MSLLLQAKINIARLFLLSIISSILLWISWPPLPLNFVIFIGFVPLLLIEDNISLYHKRRGFKVFLLAYFTFLCWNTFTTYWIWFASPGGAIMAIVLNALLMTIPFFMFHFVKRRLGNTIGYLSLICFWLCLEMLHLNWDAPWPWLNLGNVFAVSRDWVQWYEYTGALGGTVWAWVVNILIYRLIGVPPSLKLRRAKQTLGLSISIVLMPILVSYLIKPRNPALTNKANVVAVQPNIDPYNDKFDTATYDYQINTLISLSEQKVDSNTVFVAWPETAIAELINEQTTFSYRSITKIHNFLKRHPHLKLITGVNSYGTYPVGSAHSETARPYPDNSGWYEGFNAAFEMDHTDSVNIYHKFKLVPGVEKMPYPSALSFLESYSISMGGPGGSLGSKYAPIPFTINDSIKVAPIICYESIFGSYVSQFVKNGADVLTIITNDGWWQNTPGYKQHLYTGALRAIETREFIVRAANTGISCFIMPSGDILQATKFWVPASIKSPLLISHQQTFYARFGDYIGWTGVYLAGFLIVGWIVALFLKSFKKPK